MRQLGRQMDKKIKKNNAHNIVNQIILDSVSWPKLQKYNLRGCRFISILYAKRTSTVISKQ